MSNLHSNGPQKDYVHNPFTKLITRSANIYLAAPYFTEAAPLLDAARVGKPISLLIGLNEATSPKALKSIHGVPGISIRFLTGRFHAKIFVFDDEVLIGSSNLTDGGLRSNREAVVHLNSEDNRDDVEDVKALFLELWDSAHVLTTPKLAAFSVAHAELMKQTPNAETAIERAVGKAHPPNINVASQAKSNQRMFLEDLRRDIYEGYRPAFREVSEVLEAGKLRRPDLDGIGEENETNRFLNYVRLLHADGGEAWRNAPLLAPDQRRAKITALGREWKNADDSRVPDNYVSWLERVTAVFGTTEALAASDKDQITSGLMSLHAFREQSRFVSGGEKNLPQEFWQRNGNDAAKVRSSLSYLLYGPGDFVERFHDVLYHPSRKLGRFGYFCALELFGTVKPDVSPPMNGRMAKALRFLGYDVKGA
ncbi:phospholipase D-like domain-containing protein [Rhizobium leguminosarum]|uniref:phospholipase D-like domain-containing protein n=1 Tax=Rhizobium leguminosarum TaxID=384 RepID=UPI003F95C7F5